MLPHLKTQAIAAPDSNGFQKHWPGDATEQPSSVLKKVHIVEDATDSARKEANSDAVPIKELTESKWSLTRNGYADTLCSSALNSSLSKETWKTIAIEAVKKAEKSSIDSLPAGMAAGDSMSKEQAESSGVVFACSCTCFPMQHSTDGRCL